MTLSETGKKEGRKKGKGNSHWVWGFWESRVFPSSTHAGTWNYEKTTIIWNCLFPTHIFCHCISYFNELLGKNWVLRFSFSNPMTSPATTPSESGRWTKQGFTRNTKASSSATGCRGARIAQSPVPCMGPWFHRSQAPWPPSVHPWERSCSTSPKAKNATTGGCSPCMRVLV